jgi:hypothetical protein
MLPFPTVVCDLGIGTERTGAARNFPFQPESGSQISVWITESEVGLRVATTRQKPGRSKSGVRLPGGMNVPGSSTFANVIETVGETSFERLSQDWAWSEAGAQLATRMMMDRISRSVMLRSIPR